MEKQACPAFLNCGNKFAGKACNLLFKVSLAQHSGHQKKRISVLPGKRADVPFQYETED